MAKAQANVLPLKKDELEGFPLSKGRTILRTDTLDGHDGFEIGMVIPSKGKMVSILATAAGVVITFDSGKRSLIAVWGSADLE